jgi:hypothetical protein
MRSLVPFCMCCVAVFVATSLAQTSAPLKAKHGTCAIVAASATNMAFVIDSRLTRMTDIGTTRSCTARIEPACKAVLVRKDLIVGVTGIYDDPIHGVDWSATDETRKLILALPAVLEAKDLDNFAAAWMSSVAFHFDINDKFPAEDRYVSTLLVATRIHGKPYVLQVPIDFHHDRGFDVTAGKLLITGAYPELSYAGSCRDHVTTHPIDDVLHIAQIVPPIDPLPPSLKSQLDAIANERTFWSSATDLADILEKLEDVFTRADQAAGTCYIGPPYDVATWAEGESGWTTHFKRRCQQPVTPRPRHKN